MVLSNVVFVVTVLSSSSVFSQACVQVSACLANVSCGVVAAMHLILYTAPCLFFGSTLSLTLVSSCRKVVIGFEVHISEFFFRKSTHGLNAFDECYCLLPTGLKLIIAL